MWRAETLGTYFLTFDSVMNYDHLNAGAAQVSSEPSSPSKTGAGGDTDE